MGAVARQFKGAMCALCGERASSRTGEPVWPNWFFEMFLPTNGPFETWIGRQPTLRRGQPRKHSSIPRAELPACEPCNGELDRRFEKPAKSILRRIVASDARTSLAALEAEQCVLWRLRTWLLLGQPGRHQLGSSDRP